MNAFVSVIKAISCAALLSLAACANMPGNSEDMAGDSDPLEPVNRAVFQFNYALDGVVLKPVTQIYRGVMPEKGQQMVSNAIDNLYEPLTFFNSVLQADPKNSFTSLWRFLLNSTAGIGGLFDVAAEAGLKARKTDFGQTLAMYGSGPGVYVVLPVIGPSTTRDSVGRLADAVMNPVNHASDPWSYVLWGATAIDKRSQNMTLIDDIYRTSLDPYSTFRSGYTQRRASEIRRAKEARRASQEEAGF